MPQRRHPPRDLIRMAVLLHQQLIASPEAEPPLLPERQWLVCQRLRRLHLKAIQRGWFAAAQQIQPRMRKALREFQEAMTRTLAWQTPQGQSASPSLGELHAELVGLLEEFPDAEWSLRDKTISVLTEPVVLEEVYLGPFRIELDLGHEAELLSYCVMAIEPNPAANDEEVPHPHIRNGCLCEGEGTLPIKRALEAGRLSDFFQIVCQVLETYNPGSAYVALEEWEGISCEACGSSVQEDERTSCSRTGDPLCYECLVTCPDCDHDVAPAFAERCQKCAEEYCDRCLEEGICHACQEQIREEEANANQREIETPSDGCGGGSIPVEQPEPLETAVG